MTIPVANDKISTHQDVKERNLDVRPAARPAATGDADGDVQPQSDSANVGRASERLAQQLNGPGASSINSAVQARESLAQLQIDIARDPRAVLDVFAGMNQDAFAAAVAEPSD